MEYSVDVDLMIWCSRRGPGSSPGEGKCTKSPVIGSALDRNIIYYEDGEKKLCSPTGSGGRRGVVPPVRVAASAAAVKWTQAVLLLQLAGPVTLNLNSLPASDWSRGGALPHSGTACKFPLPSNGWSQKYVSWIERGGNAASCVVVEHSLQQFCWKCQWLW